MTGEKTILCYGDSNTHGSLPVAVPEDFRRLAPDARWPGVMAAALGSGWRVIEEGHGGRTTVLDDPIDGANRNGLTYLPVALESHRPVDLVLLMLGTNDLLARYNLPAGDIAAGLDLLAGSIRASEEGPGGGAPGLIIMAPPPILETGCLAEMYEGGAAKSGRLAGLFVQIAQKLECGFVDAGQHIACSPVDGVHFEAAEHKVLGNVMADAVSKWRAHRSRQTPDRL